MPVAGRDCYIPVSCWRVSRRAQVLVRGWALAGEIASSARAELRVQRGEQLIAGVIEERLLVLSCPADLHQREIGEPGLSESRTAATWAASGRTNWVAAANPSRGGQLSVDLPAIGEPAELPVCPAIAASRSASKQMDT